MSLYEPERPRRKLPAILVLLVVLAAGLIAGAIYLRPRFESQPPQIGVSPDGDAIGLAPLEITVLDAGSGLKSFAVTLSSGGTETVLASENFEVPVAEKAERLLAKVEGIKGRPGDAAHRGARRLAVQGNEAVVQRQLPDLTPPTLELVADDRYISFGGAGAIVYRTSADAATSGVRVGKHFFPGFAGQIKDKPDHLFAIFAHPYDTPPGTKAMLVSTDKAGNTREMALVYELKDVKYRKSTIAVSENFLQGKVVPLVQDAAARQGSPKDVFIAVNHALRKANDDKITG
jgi:hypothetical protein